LLIFFSFTSFLVFPSLLDLSPLFFLLCLQNIRNQRLIASYMSLVYTRSVRYVGMKFKLPQLYYT